MTLQMELHSPSLPLLPFPPAAMLFILQPHLQVGFSLPATAQRKLDNGDEWVKVEVLVMAIWLSLRVKTHTEVWLSGDI